ncbi:MAG: hypothetical protein GX884_03220 [Chloroflexi bacterium]|nr:hypothetical protein [Chloroflexota bacterium]
MSSNITIDDAKKIYGISFSHQIMENGELRFRLISSDGSSYVRTVSVTDGWQSAHYHKRGHEVYIVQEGWMVMATLVKRKCILKRYGPGSVISLESLTHHNIFLPSAAVIHTVKYGMTGYEDWWPAKALQKITLKLTFQDLLELPTEKTKH